MNFKILYLSQNMPDCGIMYECVYAHREVCVRVSMCVIIRGRCRNQGSCEGREEVRGREGGRERGRG